MTECKYCFTTNKNFILNPLIHPCACKTPVHVKCLNTWQQTRNSNTCEICNVEYCVKEKLNYDICCKQIGIIFFKLFMGFFVVMLIIGIPAPSQYAQLKKN